MDVKSEILNHANVQTTLQMYVYPSTTSKRDAMEAASMLAGIAKKFFISVNLAFPLDKSQ